MTNARSTIRKKKPSNHEPIAHRETKPPSPKQRLPKSTADYQREIEELRARLAESEDTLRAIGAGEVDALIVSAKAGEQVFTLKGAEHVYRVLVEEMNEGAATLNSEGVILFVNDAFASMIGLPLEQIMGSSFRRYVTAGTLPAFDNFLTNSVQDRSRTEIALETNRKKSIPVLLSGRSLPADSDVSWISVIVTDISERKRTERALRKSYGEMEQRVSERTRELQSSLTRFELLAETAGELLQAREPQGMIESICRKVMEQLDCHVFFNFLAHEEKGRLRLNSCAGISEEEAGRIEWLDYGTAVCGCVAQQGCRIVAERIPSTPDPRTELVKSYGIRAYACHPLFGAGGKVIGTLSFGTRSRETFNDEDLSLMKAVTDQVAIAMLRKATEEKINNLNMALAQKLHELGTVNKELEAFVYSVTHDLRAPLRSVSGMSEMLMQDCHEALNDDSRDLLSRINRGAVKMSRIIEALLRLSRTSRQNLERTDVDMSGIASAVVGDLRAMNPDRVVTVLINDAPVARADGRLMEIVLSNLLQNAWKFTSHKAGPCIEFGSLVKAGKTAYYVKDNGAGFDPHYADGLFLPFRRLHTDKEFEGTGIGLAIVERVIGRHGGRIWAEGGIDAGATFFFTLS